MSKKINLTTFANLISILKIKDNWKINEIINKANINYDELLYFLNILSDIYSVNGEYYFDFELDTINNNLTLNISDEFYEFETITDLELFKIYTLINTIEADLSFETLSKKDFTKFNNILKELFNLFDLLDDTKSENKNIILNQKTMIEYIKLGNIHREIYEIEPLLISSNNDGSILEAYDLVDKKIKTFLINRIVSVSDNLNKSSKKKKANNELEVIFNVIDIKLLKKLNNYEYKKNDNIYISVFRNKNIAIEFFIENFQATKVISPDTVKVGVMKRIESIQKILKE